MKHTFPLTCLLSLFPIYSSSANTLSPWYLGAGIGFNEYEHVNAPNGENNTYAWELFTGYRFHEYVSAELGYHHLGNAQWNSNNVDRRLNTQGGTLSAVGQLPIIGPWSATLEVGAMYYHLRDETYLFLGVAPYAGMGVGYELTNNIKLHTKYRRYEQVRSNPYNNSSLDSNYWGLTLEYHFGNASSVTPLAPPTPPKPKKIKPDTTKIEAPKATSALIKTPTPTINKPITPETHYKANHTTVMAIRFANNSSILNKQNYQSIERLAHYLKRNPGYIVEIRGHTSAIGEANYNMYMSVKRAKAVANALSDKYGIAPNRVSYRGYGSTRPLIDGDTQKAYEANRRIEAFITDASYRKQ